MSELQIKISGWDAVAKDVAVLLQQIAELEVARLQEALHEDTGRLAQTPRLAGDAEIHNGRVTSTILIGGIEVPGVLKEVGEMKMVDYAIEEEIYHPQARETIPEYANEIRLGFNAK